MGGMDLLGAFKFGIRINLKKNINDFPPIGAFGVCVQKAQIKPKLRPVVTCRLVARRRNILIAVFCHGFVVVILGPLSLRHVNEVVSARECIALVRD